MTAARSAVMALTILEIANCQGDNWQQPHAGMVQSREVWAKSASGADNAASRHQSELPGMKMAPQQLLKTERQAQSGITGLPKHIMIIRAVALTVPVMAGSAYHRRARSSVGFGEGDRGNELRPGCPLSSAVAPGQAAHHCLKGRVAIQAEDRGHVEHCHAGRHAHSVAQEPLYCPGKPHLKTSSVQIPIEHSTSCYYIIRTC